MASLEVDLSSIEPGNTITVKWRGKPVFVKHRTEEEIGKAKDEDISKLRDPQADDDRTQKPEVRLSGWHTFVHYLPQACSCHGSEIMLEHGNDGDGTVYAQFHAIFMFMKLLHIAHYDLAAVLHGAVVLHSVGHHAIFAQSY